MTIVSICRKIYNSFRGRDVIAVQENIIDSVQDECRELRRQLNNKIKDNEILQSRINELGGIRVGLQKELHELLNKPDVVVYESKFVMTQKVYDAFERGLEPPIVTNNTTAQGAGYIAGIQRALSELRKQFVTGN